MARHHTKDKGDLGVAKAHADLAEQGYLVLWPATEHAPFDLVAYAEGEFLRVQVKYRAAKRGVVEVALGANWADRHGTHRRPLDKAEVDVLCVYCPDTDACSYLLLTGLGACVMLRIEPTRNGQVRGVRMARDHRSVPSTPTSRSFDRPS